MRYFTVVVVIVLCLSATTNFVYCSQDAGYETRIRNVIHDLEEVLRQDLIDKRDDQYDDRFKDVLVEDRHAEISQESYEVQDTEEDDFDEKLQNLANRVPLPGKDFPTSEREIQFGKKTSSAKKGDSDSERNQPMEELIWDHHHVVPESIKSETRWNPDEVPPFDDTCPNEDSAWSIHKTCSGGAEYEMTFHPEYSKTLRRDMEAMRPSGNSDKCNYYRRLGTDTDVDDRSLCPFNWTINSNKYRIPEFLYEAQCPCQIANLKVYPNVTRCTQLKRIIPVLWNVDCKGGKKKYKEGWQEISVACVPVVELKPIEKHV